MFCQVAGLEASGVLVAEEDGYQLFVQSGKGYIVVSKQFGVHHSYNEKDYSQVNNLQDEYQYSQEWTSQKIHHKVRLCSAQRISDITPQLEC